MSRPDYVSWAACGAMFLVALFQSALGMRVVALLKEVVEENGRLREEVARLGNRDEESMELEEEDDDDAAT